MNNTSLFLLVFSFNISDGIIDMFVGLILYLLNMFCLLLSLLMFSELGTNILVDNIEILISYSYLYPARVLIFSVCFLSLGSLPPLIGFVSKVVLFKAMFDYSFGIVAFCIILMSVINLWYYLRLINKVSFFWGKVEVRPLIVVGLWDAILLSVLFLSLIFLLVNIDILYWIWS